MDYKSEEITIDGKSLDNYIFDTVMKKLKEHIQKQMYTQQRELINSLSMVQRQYIADDEMAAMQATDNEIESMKMKIAMQSLNVFKEIKNE